MAEAGMAGRMVVPGSLQYEAEGYSAGRDALTRYIDLVPDGGPAWALRGLCEFETAEYAKSLADLQRGLSLGAARQPSDENFLRFHGSAPTPTRSGSLSASALQKSMHCWLAAWRRTGIC